MARRNPSARFGREKKDVTHTTGDGGMSTGGRADLPRRILDVAVSVFLAFVTLPIVALALVGSAVALRAWPLFTQERVGRDGTVFQFMKVRTLPTSVPAYVDKFQLAEHHIPRFCRLLRSLHLDELPQLYLVVIGRMSVVGPRPEMAYLHEQMPHAFAARRTTVRPGCTGLWQVSECSNGLIGSAPEFDSFYLTHRTCRLDLWVLYRTALMMSGLAGPVRLSRVPAWALAGDDGETTTIDLRDPAPESSMAAVLMTGR